VNSATTTARIAVSLMGAASLFIRTDCKDRCQSGFTQRPIFLEMFCLAPPKTKRWSPAGRTRHESAPAHPVLPAQYLRPQLIAGERFEQEPRMSPFHALVTCCFLNTKAIDL
jgi:hypothetical protein